MTDVPAAPVPAPLTDAERADLLASVEGLIIAKVGAADFRRSERDDACQEIRLSVWRATATYDPARGAKPTSYFGAVVETVIRRLRAVAADRAHALPTQHDDADNDMGRLPDPRPGDDAAADPVDAALTGLIATGTAVGYAAVLDGLPPGYRRLVGFVVLDKLTVGQIAARLSHPLKSVRANLRAAVERLAAAGHVPADVAASVGLDAAELARRGDPVAVAADREARRVLVAEAGPGVKAAALAALLGCSDGTIVADRHALARPRRRAADGVGNRRAAETEARLALVAERPDRTAAELGAALGVCPKTVERDRGTLKRRSVKAA